MAAKKANKSTGKRRNAIPKLQCEDADCRFPLTTDASGRLAAGLLTFTEREAEFKKLWKEHVGGTGKAPQFNPKHFPDLSKGAMTQAALEKIDDREFAGEDVVRPPRYSPIFVETVIAIRPKLRLRRGAASKHPKPPSDWSDRKYGSWFELDEDDERTIQSGWFWDKVMPRRCHSKTAEKMVTEPEKNILTFGNNRYVVGDGTVVRAAYMLVSATKRANYKAGDQIRKRMSLAGNKDALDVVFRIEDRANNGGGVTLKSKWRHGIQEVVMLPGQAMTAGFLFNAKGKRLSAKDIRNLDADTKGLKFKTVNQVLGGPLVGKEIPWSSIWEELNVVDKANLAAMRKREGRSEEYEKGSPQACSLHNHEVTCRVGPHEANPHGFRAAVLDMVPFKITGGEELLFGAVIGDRSNLEHSSKEVDEVDEEETTPKPKRKATKKAKPADAAPPVEADTAEEIEEEEEEEVEVKA